MRIYVNKTRQWGLPKTQVGYTLLEIMLVLAIIATISVFSLGIYQQQMTNFKVDKTALQMQQWLEAAKAYYVDNAKWPDGNGIEGCDNSTNKLLEGLCGTPAKTYIQAGSIDNNIWGQGFTLIPPATENSGIFEVQTTVPVTATSDAAQLGALGQRIASRLPNANSVASTDTATITASVTVPGTSSNSNSNQVIVKSISDVQCSGADGTSGCIMPLQPTDCPSGTGSIMHVALQNFQSDPNLIATTIKQVQVAPLNYNSSDPWPAPNLLVTSTSHTNSNGSLLVIITCEPTATNKKSQAQKIVFSY